MLACLSLPILLVLGITMVEHSVAAQTRLARVINEGAPDAIPGQYIVVLKPGISRNEVLATEKIVERLGGKIGFTYTSALIGFSAKLPPNALQVLRANPRVAYIEADQKFSFDTIQLNPPTGLDRTSERLLGILPAPPLDNQYTYSATGVGVNAYVIDSGIRVTHTDFGGRASVTPFTGCAGDFSDPVGHGTHVAGTIGGTKFGIAKGVTLYSVRVADCTGTPTLAVIIGGVDWVTNNRVLPAVANLSLGGPVSAALDTAVTTSIATGVTYTVAAGNSSANASNYSPAHVPTAITVGAVNPTNDTVASFSNFGPSLDLFAPGVNILSAFNTSDTATYVASGTSMAAPHVAGVAALYLQCNAAANPAAVWAAIHYAANVSTTPGWPGIINLGTTGSPNELLHWGSVGCDGFNDGDPHLTTVGGVHYDFQSAGEFVSLRDTDGLEIQTRQSPVSTTFNPWPNPHTGLASCVSVNTAVAARVGKHRVTFQPNLSGAPDPSGLQLRVDGVLTTLGASGVNLGPGGRVAPSIGGGIEINFPDGTILIATPGWWASQSKWYINVSVFRTPATEGIMGVIAPGSWLPALPNGTSMGPKPASVHQRYVDLYQKFADAWRVTKRTSLFDYAPGTSTATFTFRDWPQENGPCVIPENPPVEPANPRLAQQVCRAIVDKNMKDNCVFDVTVTGEPGFAKTYLLSQKIRVGSTTTTVDDDKAPTQAGETVTFIATVARNASSGTGAPTGTVQFILDGEKVGVPVELDSTGRATWKTSSLKVGDHLVAASYIPYRGDVLLTSSSTDKLHTVRRTNR